MIDVLLSSIAINYYKLFVKDINKVLLLLIGHMKLPQINFIGRMINILTYLFIMSYGNTLAERPSSLNFVAIRSASGRDLQ